MAENMFDNERQAMAELIRIPNNYADAVRKLAFLKQYWMDLFNGRKRPAFDLIPNEGLEDIMKAVGQFRDWLTNSIRLKFGKDDNEDVNTDAIHSLPGPWNDDANRVYDWIENPGEGMTKSPLSTIMGLKRIDDKIEMMKSLRENYDGAGHELENKYASQWWINKLHDNQNGFASAYNDINSTIGSPFIDGMGDVSYDLLRLILGGKLEMDPMMGYPSIDSRENPFTNPSWYESGWYQDEE